MPNTSGSIDLGSLSEKDREALDALAEARGGEPQDEEENEPQKVLTAFLVIVGYDGQPTIGAFADPSLELHSPPNPDLVYGACSTVLKDLSGQEVAQAAAQMTAALLVQQAQQAQQAAEAQRLAQHLGPNLRG